jgi:putative Holliday junction resolvase
MNYLCSMGRLLAFDYGQKRTGLAETDDLQIIATGLAGLDTPDVIPFVKRYLEKNTVDAFVVGDPSGLGGDETHNTGPAQAFAAKLQKTFPSIPVHMVDESFSSREAMQSMVMGGMKKSKRRDKKILDEVSAAVILRRYMDGNSF